MSRPLFAVGTLLLFLLLGPEPDPLGTGLFEPALAPRVAAHRAAPDTLRTTATPGTPLILPLPETLRDAPVTRYTVRRGPALSGVAGRSFTWIPRGTAPGTYDVLLHAHHPDARPDTLVVRIDLQS
jgi:hypothetical protein